jgi:hypothetical protein
LRDSVNWASVGIDNRTNSLLVEIGNDAPDAQRQEAGRAVEMAAERTAATGVDAVRVRYISPPTLDQLVCEAGSHTHCNAPMRGGPMILGVDPSGNHHVCTAGFTAKGRGAGNFYVMTAGHCYWDATGIRTASHVVNDWASYQPQTGAWHRIGNWQSYIFGPGGDMGLVRIDHPEANRWNPQPWVYVQAQQINPDPTWWTTEVPDYEINHIGGFFQGRIVCKTGAFSGTTCGEMETAGVQHIYGGETVNNLGRIDYHANGDSCNGDSGAPIYKGHTAYGIHVSSTKQYQVTISFYGFTSSPWCGNHIAWYQGITAAQDALNVDVNW